MKHVKIEEVRPKECGSRIGDKVLAGNGDIYLQVKCKKCSRDKGKDTFHYVLTAKAHRVL